MQKKRGRARGKGKNSGRWADHLTQRAKEEQYPARSVYKLMEIQKKFRVMKKGNRVVDFGCAPGSWLIYAAKTVAPEGRAVGIDLKPVDVSLPENARAYVGDIFEMDDPLSKAVGDDVDVVLSDMAPATTGRKEIDTARSEALCESALDRASALLVPGGHFVCKIFQGPSFKAFEAKVRKHFDTCRIFKPESCRKTSKEIYIIGMSKKNNE